MSSTQGLRNGRGLGGRSSDYDPPKKEYKRKVNQKKDEESNQNKKKNMNKKDKKKNKDIKKTNSNNYNNGLKVKKRKNSNYQNNRRNNRRNNMKELWGNDCLVPRGERYPKLCGRYCKKKYCSKYHEKEFRELFEKLEHNEIKNIHYISNIFRIGKNRYKKNKLQFFFDCCHEYYRNSSNYLTEDKKGIILKSKPISSAIFPIACVPKNESISKNGFNVYVLLALQGTRKENLHFSTPGGWYDILPFMNRNNKNDASFDKDIWDCGFREAKEELFLENCLHSSVVNNIINPCNDLICTESRTTKGQLYPVFLVAFNELNTKKKLDDLIEKVIRPNLEQHEKDGKYAESMNFVWVNADEDFFQNLERKNKIQGAIRWGKEDLEEASKSEDNDFNGIFENDRNAKYEISRGIKGQFLAFEDTIKKCRKDGISGIRRVFTVDGSN